MFGQRLRRWPNIKPILAQRLVLAIGWPLNTAVKYKLQIAVTADFQVKQLLLFGLNATLQNQEAVTAHFKSNIYCLSSLHWRMQVTRNTCTSQQRRDINPMSV